MRLAGNSQQMHNSSGSTTVVAHYTEADSGEATHVAKCHFRNRARWVQVIELLALTCACYPRGVWFQDWILEIRFSTPVSDWIWRF